MITSSDYYIVFRWFYRKKNGQIVRPKNGKPFPIRVRRKKRLN